MDQHMKLDKRDESASEHPPAEEYMEPADKVFRLYKNRKEKDDIKYHKENRRAVEASDSGTDIEQKADRQSCADHYGENIENRPPGIAAGQKQNPGHDDQDVCTEVAEGVEETDFSVSAIKNNLKMPTYE